MSLPILDTRRLKLIDGKYTVERRSEVMPPSICDHCGRRDCAIRGYYAAFAASAEYHIRACAEFVPVLAFSVTDGLDLPRWNTVRIGRAWGDRLARGSVVAIADLKEDRLRRMMRVERAVSGQLDEIVRDHARENHAILARAVPDESAESELRRILRNAYGSNFAAPSRHATAICLRAMDER